MGNEKSGKNTELTNRDIINFFADKSEEECLKTQELLKRIQDDPVRNEKHKYKEKYVKFACSIKERRISGTSKDKLEISCDWLKNLPQECKLDAFLDGISPEKLYEESYKADFQKWHLIVSYYACKCFEKTRGDVGKEKVFLNQPCIAPDSLKCPELLLWMYEVSAGKGIDKDLMDKIAQTPLEVIKGKLTISDILRDLKNKIRDAVFAAKENNCIKQYI